MTDWKNPPYRRIVEHLAARSGLEDYITSLEVTARKPVSSAKQNDNRAAQKPGGRERA
jgi:hypothetical protein